MNKLLDDILKVQAPENITLTDDETEPNWDSEHNSQWIIGVDISHNVFVIVAPNIHPSFFDNGSEAEYIGLPVDLPDEDPGIYEITCSFHTHKDWETGIVDDYEFHIEEMNKLRLLISKE